LKQTIAIRSGDERTVSQVLARAGADDRAVEDGRVFVGRRRVRRGDEPLKEGDVVEIAPPRATPAPVRVLFHEDDVAAVDKPAGMPTIPDHGGAAHALVAVAAQALGVDAARLHPTSRLDRGVSGVVVFALTRAAAERLTRARAEGTYERRYVALASKAPSPEPGTIGTIGTRGTWDAAIGRARDPRLRAVNGREPIAAMTRYGICAQAPGGAALLAVAPLTGRTHQIRVHASHAGSPLLGDRDYGGPSRVTLPSGRVLEPRRVALHAARVVIPGANGAPLLARSPIPPELEELWAALGGEAAAWELATSCALS
jgi:23S rRNA pseudouridine1911/1915/1917 synthase